MQTVKICNADNFILHMYNIRINNILLIYDLSINDRSRLMKVYLLTPHACESARESAD